MLQRVSIAMALLTSPEILIADEPTTALDVSVQYQILQLLKGLQEKLGMALLIITHNMGVVAETADNVLVLYAGRLAECAPVKDIFIILVILILKIYLLLVLHCKVKHLRQFLGNLPTTVPCLPDAATTPDAQKLLENVK